jgi:hypothetical protein
MLAYLGEEGLKHSVTERVLPEQTAALVLGQIEPSEHILALSELWWQLDVERSVGGPVARRQHAHVDLQVLQLKQWEKF